MHGWLVMRAMVSSCAGGGEPSINVYSDAAGYLTPSR
jgi:hypothetical protein